MLLLLLANNNAIDTWVTPVRKVSDFAEWIAAVALIGLSIDDVKSTLHRQNTRLCLKTLSIL